METNINYKHIVDNNFILSAEIYSRKINHFKLDKVKEKYPNIFDDFKSFDGFAFPSSDYVTQFENLKKKVKLLQISNVNQTEWIINETQKFEYVPDKYLQSKKRYLLNSECILISLTGGTDTDNDITSYFDNSFKAFLNQRVSAFTMKDYNKDYFFYFYAMTKTKSFKEQWLGKGGIQKNTVASDRAKTYLPKIHNLGIVNFVSVLTQAIINKEKLIKERHEAILKAIETELLENQKPNKFSFELPRINELEEVGRLDTGLYNIDFKKLDFLITNYSNNYSRLKDLKYKPLRGPNLAISIIGVTHYSTKRVSEKFYKLIQPTDLSEYGTLQTERYFGNINDIQLLKKGDILFGAEGNIGKVYVNIDMNEKSVTNFHGMSITNTNVELYNKCFVACYIKWLRHKNYFKFYSTGGQGGSFGVEKTENIKIPNFSVTKQKEIAKLYHNVEVEYNADTFTLANFLGKDNEYNQQAGIYELDKTAKQLKEILNNAIDNIVNDKQIEIKF